MSTKNLVSELEDRLRVTELNILTLEELLRDSQQRCRDAEEKARNLDRLNRDVYATSGKQLDEYRTRIHELERHISAIHKAVMSLPDGVLDPGWAKIGNGEPYRVA